jgi:hypothetical protein
MKPQRCKKWEFGRSRVRTRRDTKTVMGSLSSAPWRFCPFAVFLPAGVPERATPKTTSVGGADGGGAHETLARSLLSSRPVSLLLCCNFVFCQLCYPKYSSSFAIRVEISRGTLVRTKKNQVPFAAKLAHILCFLCPSIAVVVVGWVVFWFCCYCCCWGFFAVILCAYTHSFIVVILLVWFRLFAVSFRIDKVFRPCSPCGSQGLMTARGSRGRRGWLLLLVGISGLRFSWLWNAQWKAFFKFRKAPVVVVFECTICR